MQKHGDQSWSNAGGSLARVAQSGGKDRPPPPGWLPHPPSTHIPPFVFRSAVRKCPHTETSLYGAGHVSTLRDEIIPDHSHV